MANISNFDTVRGSDYTFDKIWGIYDSQFNEIRKFLNNLNLGFVTESFIGSTSQTITLENTYVSGQLFVYVNNVIQWKDRDYEETSSNSIRLFETRSLDDVVTVVIPKYKIISSASSDLGTDSKLYFVNYSVSNSVIRSDKSIDDIFSAYRDGKYVVAHFEDPEDGKVDIPLCSCISGYACFSGVVSFSNNSSNYIVQIKHTRAGTPIYYKSKVNSTPRIDGVELEYDSTASNLGLAKAPIMFSNISIESNDWISNSPADSGFEDYSYKVELLNMTGVTADMYAECIYYDAQSGSGSYSRTGKTGNETITVYSKDNSAITIPTIIVGSPIIGEVIVSEGHHYSLDEQKVGTWIDGNDLFEKTVVTTMSSGRVSSQLLSNILGCNVDYVDIVKESVIDGMGQNIKPYSNDARLSKPRSAEYANVDYGDYCSNLVSYPHIDLDIFDTSLSNLPYTIIFYNSLDNKFYQLATSDRSTIFMVVSGVLKCYMGESSSAKFYQYNESVGWVLDKVISDSSSITEDLFNISSLYKFKVVFADAIQDNVAPLSFTYVDDDYGTSIGPDGEIKNTFFNPSTGQFLNNDFWADNCFIDNNGLNYEGQDYLHIGISPREEKSVLIYDDVIPGPEGNTITYLSPNVSLQGISYKVTVDDEDYSTVYNSSNNTINFSDNPISTGSNIKVYQIVCDGIPKLCIKRGSNYPVLPLTVYTTIQYTKQ